MDLPLLDVDEPKRIIALHPDRTFAELGLELPHRTNFAHRRARYNCGPNAATLEQAMMRKWCSIIAGALALGACSSGDGRYPSLAPRAAEAIDPRLPVVRPMNDRPVNASLASQLASLVAQARAGEAAFEPAVTNAEQLASAAGTRQSESWIMAQEALSAAVAARK